MTDWRQLAARVRGELDRADLSERQRRVAEVMIKATLMRGRVAVRVPRLEEFSRVLNISRGNLSEIFRALESARICQVAQMDGGGAEYRILADPAAWDVAWKYDREQLRGFLADLDAWTGQVQGELLPAEPDLRRAVAEVSAEGGGQRTDVRGQGTEARGQENARSRIGNEVARVVPESGTPFKEVKTLKHQTLKALSFEALNSLKQAAGRIESSSETEAMDGCRAILGAAVMANDGGKWRLRWRAQRGKVARVFAAVAEDAQAGRVRHSGAHAEDLWKRFG